MLERQETQVETTNAADSTQTTAAIAPESTPVAPGKTILRKELKGVGYARGAGRLSPAPGAQLPESQIAEQGFAGAMSPLPAADVIGASLGVDLSGVRAATGPQATEACNQLGAHAYTVGDRIAFRTPSPALDLQAHEATHVVQQGMAGGEAVQCKSGASVGALEAEADDAAAAVSAGQSFTVTGAAPSVIQRDAMTPEDDDDQDTGDVDTTLVTQSGELGEEGLQASLARQRTISATEGDEISSQQSLGYGEGQVTATLGGQESYTSVEGDRTVAGRTVTASGGLTGGSGQVSRVRGDDVSSRTETVGGGYSSEEGLSATLGSERQVSAEEDQSITVGHAVGMTGGQGTIGRTSGATWVDEDGARHTEADATTVGLGSEGVTAGHTRARVVRQSDGSQVATAMSGNANLTEGQVTVSGGRVRTDASGEPVSGVAGSGSIDVSSTGRLEGASGEVAVTRGRTSVAVRGGFRCTAQEPVEEAGQWVVRWTRETSGGGTVGGQSRRGVGVTGGLSATDATQGMRPFPTQALAQDFFESEEWADVEISASAEGAEAMEVGSQVTDTNATQGTLGATATLAGVQVGGSITVGGSHTVTVTRNDDNGVTVRVTDADMLGGSASIGAGASLGFGTSHTETASVLVSFDLRTDEGRRAYEIFVTTGIVPPRGAQIEERSQGEADTDTTTVGFLGAELAMSSTVEESRTVRRDGTVVEESIGTEGTAMTVPLVGSYATTDSIDVEETNDTDRTYRVTSTVNATSAADTNAALARATGVGRGIVDGDSSGAWTVTSSFTEAQIRQLQREVRAGRFNYHSLIFQSGDGSDFMEAIAAPGADPDTVRRALAELVAETGDRGLELIRDTIHVTPTYDLTLEGDPYFRGEAGHAAVERSISEYQSRLASGRGLSSLAGEVSTTLSQQRERLTAISDYDRYRDLPRELREREIRRSRAEVEELSTLMDEVLAAVEAAPAPAARSEERETSEAQPDTSAAPEMAECVSEEPQEEVFASVMSDTDLARAQVRDEYAAMEAYEQRTMALRDQARTSRSAAHLSHWVHVEGAFAFRNSAYEDHGQRHWYGDGAWVASYESAQRHYEAGDIAWRYGERCARDYEAAKAEVRVTMATDPVAAAGTLESRLGTLLSQMTTHFGHAQNRYDQAEEIYQRIRASLRGQGDYFQGYSHRLPEGR